MAHGPTRPEREQASDLPPCPCGYQPSEFHNLFLCLEDDGLMVATELATRAATWREQIFDDDLREPDEWLTFVASHNWRQPERVVELVRVLMDLASRPVACTDKGDGCLHRVAERLAR